MILLLFWVGGWGKLTLKTNSVKLKLKLRLRLAIFWQNLLWIYIRLISLRIRAPLVTFDRSKLGLRWATTELSVRLNLVDFESKWSAYPTGVLQFRCVILDLGRNCFNVSNVWIELSNLGTLCLHQLLHPRKQLTN